MTILSIQSFVSYGHVGNAAAAFCLQRTGHEVWPVHTVAFSNRPGYGTFAGPRRSGGEIAEILGGLEGLGVFGRCRAVLSGYLGDVAVGQVVLEAARRVRRANAGALYCCDPVMGDRGSGLYVSEDLARFFADEAVPAADILVPNHFELEVLAGRALPSCADVRDAATELLGRGPRLLIVTSLPNSDLDAGEIGNVVISQDAAWLVSTPKLALDAKGAGDAFAALFLAEYLNSGDAATALSAAVSSVFAIVQATAEVGAPELQLVAAQDRLIDPPKRFRARRID